MTGVCRTRPSKQGVELFSGDLTDLVWPVLLAPVAKTLVRVSNDCASPAEIPQNSRLLNTFPDRASDRQHLTISIHHTADNPCSTRAVTYQFDEIESYVTERGRYQMSCEVEFWSQRADFASPISK